MISGSGVFTTIFTDGYRHFPKPPAPTTGNYGY
jgi:hypothetical protein